MHVRRVLELLAPLLLMWRLQVAYMDPGNWATAIEAGSRFGYQLVSSSTAHRTLQLRSLAVCQQQSSSPSAS
jgi:Mn2+/Fe2+ NRAMP family transporter